MGLEESDKTEHLGGAGPMSEGQMHGERQEAERHGGETGNPSYSTEAPRSPAPEETERTDRRETCGQERSEESQRVDLIGGHGEVTLPDPPFSRPCLSADGSG